MWWVKCDLDHHDMIITMMNMIIITIMIIMKMEMWMRDSYLFQDGNGKLDYAEFVKMLLRVWTISKKNLWTISEKNIDEKYCWTISMKNICEQYQRKILMKNCVEQYPWKISVNNIGEKYRWTISVKNTDEQYRWKIPMNNIGEKYGKTAHIWRELSMFNLIIFNLQWLFWSCPKYAFTLFPKSLNG